MPHEPPQRSRLGGQPRPIEMIGAPSRQPAVDRLVPPCGWDDGVVGLPQADGNSTTLMSGTFNVERRMHRKLRPRPDGRASPVPAGRSNRARQLGVALGGAARRPWPTLIEPTSPRGGKTKWRATVPHVRARLHTVSCASRSVHFPPAGAAQRPAEAGREPAHSQEMDPPRRDP